MTREQIQTRKLIDLCRLIAEARPEQIERLLRDIHASGTKSA